MTGASSRIRGATARMKAAARSVIPEITEITAAISRSTAVNRSSSSVSVGINMTSNGAIRRISKSSVIASCRNSGEMPIFVTSSGTGKGSGVTVNGSAR